ncbi:MAG: flagellar basal body rod protein FlgC [Candidatus Baltobacteraceae bacterium]
MSDFDLLSVASSGMQAQRAALNIAARNVAAAEAAGPGGSYEREVPEFSLIRDALDGDDGPQSVAVTGTRREKGSSVDLLTEMIGVMNASRAYEANASVFDLGKRLAERTIDMGRL